MLRRRGLHGQRGEELPHGLVKTVDPWDVDVGLISGKMGGHASRGEEERELWGEELEKMVKHELPVRVLERDIYMNRKRTIEQNLPV